MGSEAAQRVGARIREVRQEKRLSQKELGNLLPGIVGGDQVSKWERGEHRPHDDTLSALAKVLDVDLAFFLNPAEKGPTPDLMASPLDVDRVDLVGITRRLATVEQNQHEMMALGEASLGLLQLLVPDSQQLAADSVLETMRVARDRARRSGEAHEPPATTGSPG